MQLAPVIPRWNTATRIGFRFSFAYLGLFALYFCPVFLQLFFSPKTRHPLLLSGVWPMPEIVSWTGAHIFSLAPPLSMGRNGFGSDAPYSWVQAFCLLVIAAIATGVWSVLDRQRGNYITLHKWFRLVVRFVLAGVMLLYGVFKVIPVQMPFPNLFQLVKPLGHFGLMEVLWTSMGVAPAYQSFAGCAETLGGILLIIPRTTTLGALICLADLTQVLMLNLAYDVPNKLTVPHWILFSVFLLAPEVSRFLNFFLLNRIVQPFAQPQLFRTRRANRLALAAQIVVGFYLIGMSVWTMNWPLPFSGAPKPALYGIWDVKHLSIGGQVRAPLLTDNQRWRRLVVDADFLFDIYVSAYEGAVAFQRMDDSFAYYLATIDVGDNTLTLTSPSDKNWKAQFRYERPAPDRLILDGEMDSQKIQMHLELFDRRSFTLVGNGFRWTQ